MTDLVTTQQLTKDYGAGPALQPLDLQVTPGEWVSLIGHNGSGKSTLLRMLVGMLEPSSGSATVMGHEAGSLPARAVTAYLGDTPVFYDDLSVREHLEFTARLHDVEEWETRSDELLTALGLDERADDLPSTFSRGLRQKAAIAVAFIRPFQLLIVDEPFVGLDRQGRNALLELLHTAHNDGAGLIVATHELVTVQASERLVALRDGEIIYDGTPAAASIDDLVGR